ncbi:MAG: hypothetical protein JW751_00690 [Polyangiaceae bacterium]|nr:hypothetical protein [Polyangiaceae bacterium]
MTRTVMGGSEARAIRRLGWGLLALLVGCSEGTNGETESTGGSSSGGGAVTGGAVTGGATTGGVPTGGAGNGPSATATDLTRAAVVIGSCLGDDGISRSATMLYDPATFTGVWTRYGLQASCLATAGGGCDALTTCLGYAVTPLGSTAGCDACSGSVASLCFDPYRVSLDCERLGLGCYSATCSEGPLELCDESTFVPECSAAGEPRNCRDSVTVGVPCAELGLVCNDGLCQGTGDACSSLDSSTDQHTFFAGLGCNGNVLEACVEGRRAQRDCATIAEGFTCQSVGETHFCGLGADCVPGDIPPGWSETESQCEGTTVAFCNAGRWDRVDCLSLGFTGCDVTADGALGCVPSFFTAVE